MDDTHSIIRRRVLVANGARKVGRSVVDKDDLHLSMGLSRQRIHAATQVRLHAIDGNDHADQIVVHHGYEAYLPPDWAQLECARMGHF